MSIGRERLMTLQTLWTLLQQYSWQIAIIMLFLGCIKIPTYEVRLLPYLLKKILKEFGNAINGDIIKRIEVLEDGFLICSHDMRDELRDHIQKMEEERVDRARSRILRFNDEVMLGTEHSKEHFDEILEDIDRYENYCDIHPNYENNKAVLAIKTIKEEYLYCLEHHKFLTYTRHD